MIFFHLFAVLDEITRIYIFNVRFQTPNEESRTKTQIKHKCFNGTIYKKEKQFWFLSRLTAATIKQVHRHLA